MSKIKQSLEIVTNIAIVLLCVLVGSILIQRAYFPPTPYPVPNKKVEISVGEKLNVPEVDFSKTEKTLVLALSKTCHFCTESASFYKKLIDETTDENLQLIATLPQDAKEGKDYLQKLELPIEQVKQVDFRDLNVQGTPTLILLDKNGNVLDFWVGKLPADKEEKVIAALKS